MELDTARAILQGLSTASALVSLYRSAYLSKRTVSQDEIEAAQDKAIQDVPNSSIERFAQVIDENYLKVLIENIKGIKRDTIKALGNTAKKDDNANAHMLDELDMAMCSQLRLVRRYNHGALPDINPPNLRGLEKTHNCR